MQFVCGWPSIFYFCQPPNDLEVAVLRIRYERKHRHGWSQTDLSDRCDIPQATLSLIEIGRLTPTPTQLERLSAALGVPAEELLREVRVTVAMEEVEAAR